MRIIRDFKNCPESARGAVVALGNFDGIHPGHSKVISTAVEYAKASFRPSAVMTFAPHPVSVLRPEVAPFLLTSLRTKVSRLAALGVDYLFLAHFNERFSQLSGEAFVQEILLRDLGVSHIVIGHDFIFGHKRSGNIELLRRHSDHNDFSLTQCSAAMDTAHQPYSSTEVRKLIHAGRFEEAETLLGHPFEITGRVEHGMRLGRTIGFPTLNINIAGYVRPPYGVYTVTTVLDGKTYYGVANLGIKPTLEVKEPILEVHLFDYSGDAYGKQVCVALKHFIRLEQKFDGIESLKKQIANDCQQARSRLGIGA